MPDAIESPKRKYSRTSAVKLRFGGVSDMWLTRKMRDAGFPQPVYFGGRDRFWLDDELDAWEAANASREPAAQKPTPPSRAKAVRS